MPGNRRLAGCQQAKRPSMLRTEQGVGQRLRAKWQPFIFPLCKWQPPHLQAHAVDVPGLHRSGQVPAVELQPEGVVHRRLRVQLGSVRHVAAALGDDNGRPSVPAQTPQATFVLCMSSVQMFMNGFNLNKLRPVGMSWHSRAVHHVACRHSSTIGARTCCVRTLLRHSTGKAAVSLSSAALRTHLLEIQFRVLRNPSGHTLSHAESAFGPMGRPDGSLSVCDAASHRNGSFSSVHSAAITYLRM